MQEKLNLVQVPNINPAQLSSVGAFNRLVNRFQNKWNIELEFNENARWRPGSYERLKGKITHSLFPNWSKPKGANTIRKITRFDNYGIGRFRDELIKIDDELRRFRTSKQTLNEEAAKAEGAEDLREYFKSLLVPVKDVKVSIDPLPWYTKNSKQYRNDRDSIWEANWDMPTYPIFDRFGNIGEYTGIPQLEISRREDVYRLNTNPERWFINISVLLEDIHVDFLKRTDTEEIKHLELPFGHMVVCFTMPVLNAVLNYQDIKRRGSSRGVKDVFYSNKTHIFPYESILKHPFVYKNNNGRYPYDMGNTCFGDFKPEVLSYLSMGEMGALKGILRKWASTFYLGGTSPLNNPEWMHIGMPKSWQDIDFPVSNYIPTRKENCGDLYRSFNFKTEKDADEYRAHHIEAYCDDCQLSNDCSIYARFSRKGTKLPKEVIDMLYSMLDDVDMVPGIKDTDDIGCLAANADAVVLKTIKLWNDLQFDSDYNVNRLYDEWHLLDCGTGNIRNITVSTTLDRFRKEMMAPEEDMNYQELANAAYDIYRIMERTYWFYHIHEGYMDFHNQATEEHYYKDIDTAESMLPVQDLIQMVNSYRITINKPSMSLFHTWLQTEVSNASSNTNQGPF